MPVKALITAQQSGSSLHPMTCTLPTSLIPILEKPLMEYTLWLLRRHGIGDVTAVLGCRAAQIREAFGNGNQHGIKLRYMQEDASCQIPFSNPSLQKRMKDTFILMPGDILTDCDLKDALRFHRARRALATLVTRQTDAAPPQQGIHMDEQGNITHFAQSYAPFMYTGICLLEPEILDCFPMKNSPDMFPKLLNEGKRICGYVMEGYWRSIHDQDDYLQAQFDLLAGKAKLPHRKGIAKDACIHPSAEITGLSYIGSHVKIGPDARLHDALLFQNCTVHSRAVIDHSCLWAQSAAKEDAVIRHGVLCERATAHPGSYLSARCALGMEANAGSGSMLHPGVQIYPFLSAPSGSHVRCSILNQSNVPVPAHGSFTMHQPEEVCHFAAALQSILCPEHVLVTAASDGLPAFSVLTGSLCALGIRVSSALAPALPIAQTLVRLQNYTCGLHISPKNITLLSPHGDFLPPHVLQHISQHMIKGSSPSAPLAYGLHSPIADAEKQYLQTILPPDVHPASLSTPFKIFCSNKPLLKICGKALINAGARHVSMNALSDLSLAQDEVGLILHEDGTHVLPITQDFTPTPEQNTLLALLCCRIYNGQLFNTHPALPQSADVWGKMSPDDHSPACRKQKQLLQDGVALCAHLAPLLDAQSLQHWLSQLPENHVNEQMVLCSEQQKGYILRHLRKTDLPCTWEDGLYIVHPRGRAVIVPDPAHARMRIRGESRDSEFAKELCDLYSRKVRDFLHDTRMM